MLSSVRTLIMTAFLFTTVFARAEVGVQSFQTWKSNRVDEARTALEKLQGERPSAAKVLDRKPLENKAPRVDLKLQQAQLNLEVARELTISDYFVLYLSQFKSRDAFVEAAKKLNPEESADLMMSYQKHLATGASSYDHVDAPSAGLGAVTPTKTN